jgi:hypothetical protein
MDYSKGTKSVKEIQYLIELSCVELSCDVVLF